jgi:hypothetical protein
MGDGAIADGATNGRDIRGGTGGIEAISGCPDDPAANVDIREMFWKYAPNAVSCAIPTGTTRVSGKSPGLSPARFTTATSDISRLASPYVWLSCRSRIATRFSLRFSRGASASALG